MVRRLLLAVALLAMVACSDERAAPIAPEGTDWRTLAERDGRFALDLLQDNHPAALKQVRDTSFQADLAKAEANWRARLPAVTSYAGYAAVMRGLAAEFGDPPHLVAQRG